MKELKIVAARSYRAKNTVTETLNNNVVTETFRSPYESLKTSVTMETFSNNIVIETFSNSTVTETFRFPKRMSLRTKSPVIARSAPFSVIARRSRSNLGDSSLCSEQAPQSRLPRSLSFARNDKYNNRISNNNGFVLITLTAVTFLMMIAIGGMFGVMRTFVGNMNNQLNNIRSEAAIKGAIAIATYDLTNTAVIQVITADILENNFIDSEYNIGGLKCTLVNLDDEEGKLNLNKMSYALGEVLKKFYFENILTMTSSQYYALVEELGNTLNLQKTKDIDNREYYYRADVDISFEKQKLSPPDISEWINTRLTLHNGDQNSPYFYSPTNTEENKYYSYTLKPTDVKQWRKLNDLRELFSLPTWREVMSIEILEKYFTVAPTIGLNVNTSSKVILQAVMNWQMKASLGWPNFKEVYDNELEYSWGYLKRKWPDIRGAINSNIEEWKTDDIANNLFAYPHFRGYYREGRMMVMPREMAYNVIEKRPYYPYEINQRLLYFPLRSTVGNTTGNIGYPLWQLDGAGSIWQTNVYIPTIDIILEGPGPYTATSQIYTIAIEANKLKVKLQIKLSRDGLPYVLKYKREVK